MTGRVVALVGLALVLVSCGGGGEPTATSAARRDQPTSTSGSAGATTTVAPATTVARRGDLDGRVIVVDPGHNGANGAHPAEIGRLVDAGGFQKACNTTGAAEGSVTESSINWELAQVLAARLRARGARVVLTRDSDEGWGPCVDQRGLTAQREGADAIVSIHADGAAPAASGFHVIRAATGPTVTPAVRDASARLAVTTRDALVGAGLEPAGYVGGGEGIVERGDIATLNRAGVAGVMVECGNLHHPGDLAVLTSPEGRDRIASALADALAAHLASS